MMRLEKASYKAIKYACLKFHYAKRVPMAALAYSIFNDDEWCGIVSFGFGIGINTGKSYGLNMGEVVELTRVALNGKQTCTSEVVAMCLRALHKDCPQVRLVVSYADADQKHYGTIYQATNWIYVGAIDESKKDRDFMTLGGG